MKAETDNLFNFDMPHKINKNNLEFDRKILSELVGMEIPTKKFESVMRKIMRQKSSCSLWWSNHPMRIWDGKEYHDVDYRCCPSSHKARNLFCLVLERTEETIKIMEGYLEAV